MIPLLIAALLLAGATATCPEYCSGHGICPDASARCECFAGYTGGKCSLRVCASAPAWGDIPSADEVAHQEATCSNVGICDEASGACTCDPNFAGAACERLACPAGCNGKGVCRSMKEYAEVRSEGFFNYVANHAEYTSNWDADVIWGCDCDQGYTGYDCSLRRCPTGDDPYTVDQVDEVQLFTCKAGDGSMTFTFRGETTEPVEYDADATALTAALTALSTINAVTVLFALSHVDMCGPNDDQVVSITFTRDFGDLPDLYTQTVNYAVCDGTETDASYTCGSGTTFAYDGNSLTPTSMDAIYSVTGTKENEECSNRGLCETDSGLCVCFDSFQTSDGVGGEGTRGDCGNALTTITSCPGETACSDKGVCNTDNEYTCSCTPGYTGGDCSLRTCDTGRSWFAFPTADNEAHLEDVECSNMGICDRDSGDCTCLEGWEGSACDVFSCPGDPECSGHGSCFLMEELGDEALANGVSTPYTYGKVPNDPQAWDYQSIKACICDEGYEGYDCSQLVCPKGDDPDTGYTTGDADVHETQLLTCNANGGYFTLTFREQTTASIAYNANAETLKSALTALSTIDDCTVTFSEGDELCTTTHLENIVTIVFTQQLGDVPDLTVTMYDGSGVLTLSHSSNAENWVEIAVDGAGLDDATGTTYVSAQGTMENEECSNRGVCDRSSGDCTCFTGFGSSDGNNGPGTRGDCGWKMPYEATAA